MGFLRKLGLGLTLVLYLPLLLLLASVVSFNLTVAKKALIKHNLEQSGVYSALSDYVISQANKGTELSKSPLLASSLKKTVSPQELQKIAEPAIDTVYLWLDNPRGALKVSVSVEPLKRSFSSNVLDALSQKLATLPACSPSTVYQSGDPFEATCLPAGVTKQDVLNQAKSQLVEQNFLPADNNLSLDSSKPTTDSNLATPVQDNNLKLLASIYRATKASWPYILGLTLLCAAGILLLNESRARGLKRFGKLTVIAAIMIGLTSGSMLFLLAKFAGVRPGIHPTIATTFEEAGKLTINQALRVSLWFGAAYVVIGVAALSTGTVMGKEQPGTHTKVEHVEQENLLPPDDEEPRRAENAPQEPKPELADKKPPKEPKQPQSTKITIK